MIYGGDWPCELIIWLLRVLKNDIGEVEEVVFQGVERPNSFSVFWATK
jgi:hypothetical protein